MSSTTPNSIILLAQINEQEVLAQFYADKAAIARRNRLAEAEVRFVSKMLAAQDRAAYLRTVLEQRKAERLARRAFVYKCLAAQKLAHAALAEVSRG